MLKAPQARMAITFVENGALLGGSWYFLTNDNCTYNCTYDHIRALKGLIRTEISTVVIGLKSTMNLQVASSAFRGRPKTW